MLNETEKKTQEITKYQLLQSRRDLIIYKLRTRGYTVSDLARNLGVTTQAVTNGLRVPYPRIEKVISEILDEPVQTLFPERYDYEGRSLRWPGRPQKNKNTTEPEKINANDLGEFSNFKNKGGEKMASKKTIMKLIDLSRGLMECRVCGSRHCANVKPDSGGKFQRGSWKCLNGCTRDDLKKSK
jgi:lambda repressor-like predicted transcriptional regulator